ncbi:MAG: hypothetical protein PVJ67_02805 [Candidatus Pacearchaeota archaeon]|jgi:hypothetical protein
MRKITINFSNKVYITIVSLILVIILIFGVYAYGTSDPAVFGHSSGEIEGAIPSGAVMAFNLNTCPGGWSPADGSGVSGDYPSLDLRGVFVRGMETFDGVSFNNRDEDRSGAGTLGTYQDDEFEEHRHQLDKTAGGVETVSGELSDYRGGYSPIYTSYEGGTETRPKNVALIYCVRD